MHAVIVSEEPCYPANAGNRIRALNLMLQMARRHRITYICRDQGNAAEAELAKQFLLTHGIETLVVSDPVRPRLGFRFALKLAANLFSSLPYTVNDHNSLGVHQAIREVGRRHQIDLWQFEWLPYLNAVRDLPDARTVVMAYDVIALVWQRYHAIEPSALKRFFIRQQQRKFVHFEKAIYQQASQVIAVTEEDANRIRQLYGIDQVAVVDNGVDNAYFQEVQAQRDPHAILFLGDLAYRPNQDGLRLMLEEIFPVVRKRHPSARMLLVGRRPPQWLVRRVEGSAGVELHANVPDVRPYLARCAVLAVPLRVGGGSRIKILEALAAGLPVLSTRIGAEGLHLQPGRDLTVVEQVEQMGETLARLLEEPDLLRRTAIAGNQQVQQRYDWAVLGEQLEAIWQSCGKPALKCAELGKSADCSD